MITTLNQNDKYVMTKWDKIKERVNTLWDYMEIMLLKDLHNPQYQFRVYMNNKIKSMKMSIPLGITWKPMLMKGLYNSHNQFRVYMNNKGKSMKWSIPYGIT